MDITKEFLEEKGFALDSTEGVIVNYVKKINDRVDLVLAISPLEEFFIWVKDEDFEDPNMDGVKVHLDTNDFDLAEKAAQIIVGIEY
ncbi:hypothetical protein ATE49_15095 [Elizabethkingia miricola]|uniref:Uncharacterized protein n=1 Tax=Elizabethkingia miricola TaxID=172045 RepID=A0ABY3NAI5_ELIMR|nr:hypothetical protein [Elizabethkingia miricola]MCT4190230.1 hypothetical protein [Elizabethkingia anophelis]MDV3585542.1 hypothetical protein [Elizabethkingia anophelis]MDV3786243.1 hypothetical protein [Elizabethkingia anophelis]OBS12978.1 hypothetical protein ATE49_15095 [Elizabethkingia miricola]TYO84194.1 hypothetical protein LX74_03993 [Elizabethkingia miricola]